MNANFPAEFTTRMSATLGERWGAFLKAHGQPAPVSVRRNPAKHSGMTGDPVPWSRYGLYLQERPSFVNDPHLHGGTYYVQEASSMFLEQALQAIDLSQPLKVLDLCAAPGGKSTHLLSLLHPEGLLVSNEVIRSRAFTLQENLQKWGLPNVIITNNDPSHFRKLNGYFDVIVVDAPCSGEGLFRKEPDSIQEWSEENAHLCSLRQRRILQAVWPSLKTGGMLVYCTCTYNPEENEKNLAWFAEQEEISFVPLTYQQQWGVEHVVEGSVKGVRLLPDRVKGEGFFFSVLRKTQGEEETHLKVLKSEKDKVGSAEGIAKYLIRESDKFLIYRHDYYTSFYPKAWGTEPLALIHLLNVVQMGTPFMEREGKKENHTPALALSTRLNLQDLHVLDLDLNSALLYLRRESILPLSPNKGLHLVRFDGTPLGWINHLGNRCNNLWPKGWRIRKSLTWGR